jgi:hypothetical protein
VEVFACACPAWTSHHERIAVEQRVHAWRPDLVLALSGANDAHWGWGRRDPAWSRTYEDEHFFRLAEAALARAGAGPLPDVAPEAEGPIPPAAVAAGLVRNARLAAAALEGVPYLLCLQPVLPCTAKPLTPREAAFLAGKPAAEVAWFREVWPAYRAALAAAGGPRWEDLDPVAVGAGGAELFLDSYHFGDRGNELLGRRLAELALPLLPR